MKLQSGCIATPGFGLGVFFGHLYASTAHRAACLLHAVLVVALWFGVFAQDTSAADGAIVARVNGEAITLGELAQFEAESRTSDNLGDHFSFLSLL